MAHVLGSCELSFGVAGWSYPDWEEIVYPPGMRDRLRYLAGFVDLIEVNASFYGFVAPATAERWLARIEDLPGFRFSAKANRLFTHEDGAIGPAEMRAFAAGFEPLRRAGRFAALLFQFPFGFRDGDGARRRLAGLARGFEGFPLVLEVRHRSWQAFEALEFLKETGYSVANVDLPLASDTFSDPCVATGEPGYLRLHGRNARDWFSSGAGRDARYDYLYGDEELDELARRIETLARRFRELIVVLNNHYRGQALANLAELSARVGGEPRLLPHGLLRTYPRLAAVARPAPRPADAGAQPRRPGPSERRARSEAASSRGNAQAEAPPARAAVQRDLFES